MLSHAPLGLAQVAQEVAASAVENPAAASAAVIARADKRTGPEKDRFLRGADAAAKARAKREEKVVQSSAQPLEGRDAEDLIPAGRPGIMLVRFCDEAARRKALQLKFKLTEDPVDFVKQVGRVPTSSGKGNVVLAPMETTDYSLSARIAVALMGGFSATAKDFLDDAKRPQCGIMHQETCKIPKQTYHVAVSQSLADEFPTVPHVLEAVAQAPGNCFRYYRSTRRLCKFFKKTVKTAPRVGQKTFVLAQKKEINNGTEGGLKINKKYLALYHTLQSFEHKFHASSRALCPGSGGK